MLQINKYIHTLQVWYICIVWDNGIREGIAYILPILISCIHNILTNIHNKIYPWVYYLSMQVFYIGNVCFYSLGTRTWYVNLACTCTLILSTKLLCYLQRYG